MSTWPRVPGYRPRWQLYLDYPWRLEAGNRVYTPQGVEQVTDITGLPGIICKALWASFSKKKRYIRTAYYYYYYCWGTQCYMYFLCNTVMGLENSRMAMASIIEYEIKFCLHVCLSRVSFGDREHQCTHGTSCQDLCPVGASVSIIQFLHVCSTPVIWRTNPSPRDIKEVASSGCGKFFHQKHSHSWLVLPAAEARRAHILESLTGFLESLTVLRS